MYVLYFCLFLYFVFLFFAGRIVVFFWWLYFSYFCACEKGKKKVVFFRTLKKSASNCEPAPAKFQPREAAPKDKGANFPSHPYQRVSSCNFLEYCLQSGILFKGCIFINTSQQCVLKIQLGNLYSPVVFLVLIESFSCFITYRL